MNLAPNLLNLAVTKVSYGIEVNMFGQNLQGFLLLVLIGLGAFLLAASAEAQMISVSKPQIIVQKRKNFPLRVIGRQDFCARFSDKFESLAKRTGLGAKDSSLFGSNATTGIVSEFRGGRASDFINAGALSAMAGKPNFLLPGVEDQDGFLPLSDFVAGAMGIGRPVHLVLSPTELRYLPFSQQEMELIVIATTARSLTPDRARKVAAVASTQKMRIHVVWAGASSMNENNSEAMSLAYLSAVTGGSFVDLGGSENPCTSLL